MEVRYEGKGVEWCALRGRHDVAVHIIDYQVLTGKFSVETRTLCAIQVTDMIVVGRPTVDGVCRACAKEIALEQFRLASSDRKWFKWLRRLLS